MDGLEYNEMIRQEYAGNNCVFSAGFVYNDPIDTVYLKMEKQDTEPMIILLRPDELAAIAWCATGVLWSHEMMKLQAKEPCNSTP